jgi:hypothetical protein
MKAPGPDPMFVVIEIKTGYPGYHQHKGMLNPPLHTVPNSNYNLHQLQTLSSMILFCHAYGVHPSRCRGVILRADARGVDHLPLEQWSEDLARPELTERMLVAGGFTKKFTRDREVKARRAIRDAIKAAAAAAPPKSKSEKKKEKEAKDLSEKKERGDIRGYMKPEGGKKKKKKRKVKAKTETKKKKGSAKK